MIALQWWNGNNQPPTGPPSEQNYLGAERLYSVLGSILTKEKVKRGLALLHGHSRGGARVYPLTFLDRSKGTRFFRLSVVDAGGLVLERPDIQMITSLASAHFVLYCGAHDRRPELTGCEGMAVAPPWLASKGAKVELFIQDPNGDHGGFQKTASNVEQTLDVFARLLRGG